MSGHVDSDPRDSAGLAPAPGELDPRLLFLALLACEAPEEALRKAWDEARAADGGVPAIRVLAARFRVHGLVSRFVSGLPREEVGPELLALVADGMRAEARAQAALAMVRVIDSAMSEADGPAVLVKGAGLRVAGLYENGERDFVDADLVVRADSVPRIEAICRQAGFTYAPHAQPSHEAATAGDGGLGTIDIHVALAGDAGCELGPAWEAVAAFSSLPDPSFGFRHVRVLRGQPAREAAVHHFVMHHDGDPANALRALQDLVRLDREGDGGAVPDEAGAQRLPWQRASYLSAVTERLGAIAVEFHSGSLGIEGWASQFLERLSMVALAGPSSDEGFAREVERWIALKGSWLGRARLVLGRALASGPGAGFLERVLRPARLSGRWAFGRISRFKNSEGASARGAWTGFLGAVS